MFQARKTITDTEYTTNYVDELQKNGNQVPKQRKHPI